MLTKLMGAAVFSVGFVMLLLALFDLLGLFHFDFGQRLIVYVGGVILCVLGYFMARRLPVAETLPEEIIQTTTEVQQPGPPPEHF